MDLLLTHGYFLAEDRKEQKVMKPYPPLGLLYLSAFLKSKGVDVRVYDTTFKKKTEFYRFIESERPSLVGIYSNLMTKTNVLQLVRFLKTRGTTVILGGPEATYNADDYIKHGVDIVVVGEGEVTLTETARSLLDGNISSLDSVAGIVYRRNDGSVVHTAPRPYVEDLDTLPLPDRNSIDIRAYIDTWRKHHGMGSVSLITARGCPFHCNWCSTAVYGHSHRRRSAGRVADEIAMLKEQYRPDMLWFADDVFAINHKWFFEFAAELKRRRLETPFECISRADRLTEEVLRTMKELGCFRVWFGSESGSQRVLDSMERGVTVEQIRTTTKSARKYGIEAGLFVMLGYAGETVEEIEETIEHLKKADPNTFLTTVAYPIKGTGFYEKVSVNLVQPGPWDRTPEREISFRGRYCRPFYWFANRRLVNEVRFHQVRSNNGHAGLKALKLLAKARVARLGMSATKYFRS